MTSGDKWDSIFRLQEENMRVLESRDVLPSWPIDLTTKQGQRMIKEIINDCHGELWEATYTLKNKLHKQEDDRSFDRDHYKEELMDALAYLIETCILSGFSGDEMYEEFKRKNKVVRKRFEDGY